ncbi:hypothetical protein MJ904_12475 [Massilia sp. MB5]|uniref:hypothetical protein n=1 Tax=Massilia sp. MB5 TaxID=2919578 RepID=UPI001F0EFBC3|nr:hypothetical protein [Massilia sp. MB5]UMR32901.1 hypothetical protein MJ904_12475 [Massilia sp. MB5]
MLGNNHKIWGDRRKIVSISENGRCYRGSNGSQKQLSCYQVDGGLINVGPRCDFALTNNNEDKVYLIELKGKDICHAADQIRTTIDKLSSQLAGKVVFARIICTRVPSPRIRKPAIVKLEQIIASLSGNVVVASLELKEEI